MSSQGANILCVPNWRLLTLFLHFLIIEINILLKQVRKKIVIFSFVIFRALPEKNMPNLNMQFLVANEEP